MEIDGRNFYDQPINDSVKQYDEIRKISTIKSDDYTTGYLLDFDFFEKSYRLSAVDLSKRKALDADSRAFQQIIFTVKVSRAVIIYCILEKIKRNNIRFLERNNKSSLIEIKMVEYNKVNVQLSDTQLKKIKNSFKKTTGTTLKINLKKYNGNNLTHELLFSTREKIKVIICQLI